MNDLSELEKIRRVLELARSRINQQEADLALANLREIRVEIERHAGTTECAEFSLLIAEAYCAKCEEVAITYLDEAAERIQKLDSPAPEMEFRLWEHFGDFHARVSRRFSKAREYYARAKSSALALGVAELVARVELKIIRIDLHTDQDAEEENFKTLRRVGREGAFTYEQQLAAWHIHYGNSDGATKGLRFARHLSRAGEDYFRDLLNSVQQGPA